MHVCTYTANTETHQRHTTQTHTHTHIRTSIHTNMYIRTQTHVHIRTSIHTQIYVYTYTTHTQIHKYTLTHHNEAYTGKNNIHKIKLRITEATNNYKKEHGNEQILLAIQGIDSTTTSDSMHIHYSFVTRYYGCVTSKSTAHRTSYHMC